MFFGALTLLVLPLFLLVSVQMIKNSSWNDTVVGKILIVLFYIVAITAVLTALYLFTQIGEDVTTLQ
jgi:hypothetical protein